MGATPAHASEMDSPNSAGPVPAVFPSLQESGGANHARWEFNNRKALLYALVGNDFGSDPESKLDEIREYKKNEAKFLIQSLNLKPHDRVLDLGSAVGEVIYHELQHGILGLHRPCDSNRLLENPEHGLQLELRSFDGRKDLDAGLELAARGRGRRGR